MYRETFILVAVLVLTRMGMSQNLVEPKSGLFGEATQLPIVSQSVIVKAGGADALFEVEQVFYNSGKSLSQAEYRLHLPEGASVTDFGFWDGGEYLGATLKERLEAKKSHKVAGATGYRTALLEHDGKVHSFTVYPIQAGAYKKVKVSFRVPVVMEMGQSHVRVSVDELLGQKGPNSTVLVEVDADEKLVDFGFRKASDQTEHAFKEIGRSEKWARFITAALDSVELWWSQETPDVLVKADAVPLLSEGDFGVQVRIALGHGGDWKPRYEQVLVFVDTSFSMRFKIRELTLLLQRLENQSPAPIMFYALNQKRGARQDYSAEGLLGEFSAGRLGHAFDAKHLEPVWDADGCDTERVKCLIVADPQLADLSLKLAGETILLGDAYEYEHFFVLSDEAFRKIQVEVDPVAAIHEAADAALLPVLRIHQIESFGVPLDLINEPRMEVTEGSMVRMYLRVPSLSTLDIFASINERSLMFKVEPKLHGIETLKSRNMMWGVYREVLRSWMRRYQSEPNTGLKQAIVDLSLREEIPTALTSLHVEDPALSLYSIKPGDPILSVQGEPGLDYVEAWYPFGASRRLAFDAESNVYSDRFLVPRGWGDRSYRIEVFKHFDNKTIRKEEVWYRIDNIGPNLMVRKDGDDLVIRDGDGRHLGAVVIHREDGSTVSLSPVGGLWAIRTAALPKKFRLMARDRAGNRTWMSCQWQNGSLELHTPRPKRKDFERVAHVAWELEQEGDGIAVRAGNAYIGDPASPLWFPLRPGLLNSLRKTGLVTLGDHRYWLSTQAGDLLELNCEPSNYCVAEPITVRFIGYPITGLASLSGDRVLIGVLGQGLFEYGPDGIKQSSKKVGSLFVTGIHQLRNGLLLIGTAYNGLWRIVGDGVYKTRFPHEHVAGFVKQSGRLVIESGFGRFKRLGTDRYRQVKERTDVKTTSDFTFVDAVRFRGRDLLAAFDGGLFELSNGNVAPLDFSLSPGLSRINRLAVWDDSLWVGTERGLMRFKELDPSVGVEVVTENSIHDLAVGTDSLLVASSKGLLRLERDGLMERLDRQAGISRESFGAVAVIGDSIFGGTMDGLYQFDANGVREIGAGLGFDGGWVTSLVGESNSLWIGTYDAGVYLLKHGKVKIVSGVEDQWVPPGGMSINQSEVWVGGIGMAPARIHGSNVERTHVPARDVYGVTMINNELWFLTNEGLMKTYTSKERLGPSPELVE